MNEYDIQAKEFMDKFGIKMLIWRVGIVDHFPNDNSTHSYGNRYKYKVTMKRSGRKSYSFNFYDSIHNYMYDKRPRPYDVLACLEKYEPYGNEYDFANEYGYDVEDMGRVKRIYNACKKQYEKLLELLDDDGIKALQMIN